jgi:hypothetical protein
VTSMRHLQSGRAPYNQQLVGRDIKSTKALAASLLSAFANATEIRVHEDSMMNRQYLFSSDLPGHYLVEGVSACL